MAYVTVRWAPQSLLWYSQPLTDCLKFFRFALALEAQMLPDSIHHQRDPAWAPSPVLRAGEMYQQRTGYRFFEASR